MYARIVNMKLKKDAQAEFIQMFEHVIIPVMHRQDGFCDEVSLFSPERSQVTGISFWNKMESADEYNRAAYPHVLKTLEAVIEGTPAVETCEVSNSTFHKIASGPAF
jgi:heme-degrading monooxygenase HmoA